MYGSEYVLFDRNINVINKNINDNDTDIKIVYEDKPLIFDCPIQGRALSESIKVYVGNCVIELLRVDHPQIINAINIQYRGNLNSIEGIFNSIYNPKHYKIKHITCDKKIGIKSTKKYNKHVKELWFGLDNNKICQSFV